MSDDAKKSAQSDDDKKPNSGHGADPSGTDDDLLGGVDDLLPGDDDFALAALDFLSAEIGPGDALGLDLIDSAADAQSKETAPSASDFFDTGQLTSLASMDWMRGDDATPPAADTGSAEPAALFSDDTNLDELTDEQLERLLSGSRGPVDLAAAGVMEFDDDKNERPKRPSKPKAKQPDEANDGLMDLAESLTQAVPDDLPPADAEDDLRVLEESLTQAVVDEAPSADADNDDLTDLAESFTQAVPDTPLGEADDLLDLAESFTQAVPDEPTAIEEWDDELLELAESLTKAVPDELPEAALDDEAMLAATAEPSEIDSAVQEAADRVDAMLNPDSAVAADDDGLATLGSTFEDDLIAAANEATVMMDPELAAHADLAAIEQARAALDDSLLEDVPDLADDLVEQAAESDDADMDAALAAIAALAEPEVVDSLAVPEQLSNVDVSAELETPMPASDEVDDAVDLVDDALSALEVDATDLADEVEVAAEMTAADFVDLAADSTATPTVERISDQLPAAESPIDDVLEALALASLDEPTAMVEPTADDALAAAVEPVQIDEPVQLDGLVQLDEPAELIEAVVPLEDDVAPSADELMAVLGGAQLEEDIEPLVDVSDEADAALDELNVPTDVLAEVDEPPVADSSDDLLELAEEAVAVEPPADEADPLEALTLADSAESAQSAATDEDPLLDPYADWDQLLRTDDSADALDLLDAAAQDELVDLAEGASDYLDNLVASIDASTDDVELATTDTVELTSDRRALRGDERQYIVFALGDTEFGIPADNVVEVGEPIAATPIPFVPEWVRGVINLRGDIVSLVDLSQFLHLDSPGTSADSWMIITQTSDTALTVGVIVDDVRGNRVFRQSDIVPLGSTLDDRSAEFVRRVYKNNDALIAALDFDKLLNSAEMRQFEPV